MREIYKKKKKMARTRAVPRHRPNVNPQQRPNVVKIKFLLPRVKDIEVKYRGNVVRKMKVRKNMMAKKKKRKIWIKTNGRCCIIFRV